MTRKLPVVVAAVAAFVVFVPAALATPPSDCDQSGALCAEVSDSIAYGGGYVGHDEPSLLFYSNRAGSGNSNVYKLTLPTDPKVMPNQGGTGGTWNFQLRPAFWLGMAMCDTQSYPLFTSTCTPDSDTNIADGSNPAAADYIGKHTGTAFMEMQFYPPGWAPFQDLGGISCSPTQWCAALNIDSLSENPNTGQDLNGACQDQIVGGVEYVNFAFVTKNGTPQAPPDPLHATGATFTPDPARDLFMGSGDQLVVDMHDTPAGFQVLIHDLTTGQSGSMTASAANGFAQVNFAPPPSTSCSVTPYNFHPMYSTSSEHTRVPWTAHSYNVAFSDEIGHWEYCNAADTSGFPGACTTAGVSDPAGLDGDDFFCLNASDSLLAQVAGCAFTDNDFDGTSYQQVWPGTGPNRGQDAKYHPSPVQFTSPLFNGNQNYDRVAFEADLPRIEAADFGGICNRTTGANCVNPPPGSNFYPFYTTGTNNGTPSGSCVWQLGGADIKGTTNTFGGNSAAEFGPLLFLNFATFGNPNMVRNITDDFRQVLTTNPCPA
jgi:hypothetical protein